MVDVTSPTTVLKAVSPEVTLMLTVDRSCRRALPDVQALVLAVKPELTPAMSVGGYLGGELRAVIASQESLVAEYRRSAGAKANAAHEARYPSQRRKFALWGLLWLLVLPVAGTALTVVLAPAPLGPGLIVRSLVELAALFFAGGFLQRRLAPVLTGWLKG